MECLDFDLQTDHCQESTGVVSRRELWRTRSLSRVDPTPHDWVEFDACIGEDERPALDTEAFGKYNTIEGLEPSIATTMDKRG